MSDKSIIVEPDVIAARISSELERRQTEAELKLLESEAKSKTLNNSEIHQRIWLRWGAVTAACIVIVAMALVMMHLVHKTFWGPFSFTGTAFKVAMVVAPIASITTITVSLLVGAFRNFDDKDMEALHKGISAGKSMWPSGD